MAKSLRLLDSVILNGLWEYRRRFSMPPPWPSRA